MLNQHKPGKRFAVIATALVVEWSIISALYTGDVTAAADQLNDLFRAIGDLAVEG